MMMMQQMMGGAMQPAPCELYDGPCHVNIVLNGTPGCCCCGPQPLHPDYMVQRAGGMANTMMEAMLHVQGPTETINFNTWAKGGMPQPLQGRVDPAVWVGFVNAISALEMAQPGCFASVFMCKCCTSGAEFEAALAGIEASHAGPLGATGFSKRVYTYQVWVPYQPGSPGSDGNPGTPPRPAHWENRTLDYLRVDFAQPFANYAAAPAGAVPMMAMPPGAVVQNPMMMQPQVMQQQQQQPQGGMYGGAQPMGAY